jgi:hypothetical protein
MSFNWDIGDAPPSPSHADLRRHRRRVRLAALGGIALLIVAGTALVSWQRRERLAAAERAVRAAADLEQRALAARDPVLFSAIMPERSSPPEQSRLVRDAQLQVPGVNIVGDRGSPAAVRFRSSRPGAALDRAEVEVRTVISDAYATGEVVRRRQFAQAADGNWKLLQDDDLAAPAGRPTSRVGTVLTTTVQAGDEALAKELHAALDTDLAAFCAAARAAGRERTPNSCAFQLLSAGLPVQLNRSGGVTGVWLFLPSPPGSLVAMDEASRALLHRAYLREMIARWEGRGVAYPLLDAWLAPEPAQADASRDWADLDTDLQSYELARLTGNGRGPMAKSVRLLAADVAQLGGRHALLRMMFAWTSASPALLVSEGLADEKLEQAVLARWEHAPSPMPADRALLIRCTTPDDRGDFLLLPGRTAPVDVGRLVCLPGWTASNSVWRPYTGSFVVTCTLAGLEAVEERLRLFDVPPDGRPTLVDELALDQNGDIVQVQAGSVAWSDDGQELSWHTEGAARRTWRPRGGHPPENANRSPTTPEQASTDGSATSPDGRWLAAFTDEQLVIRSTQGAGEDWQTKFRRCPILDWQPVVAGEAAPWATDSSGGK